CVQASSFENYIAEKAFTDRFVQQSRFIVLFYLFNILKILSYIKMVLNKKSVCLLNIHLNIKYNI
ncbi:MAG: hypothetical protein ACN6NV_14220, partial [Acinetobacter gandensis]|uniref:hypothetical protein n=1 Tax=Acinetobacter gandensis TaxID=1443941 RepID=UPI003CFF78AA